MQIVIHNKENNKYYMPAVQDDVIWELNRKGTPGKFTFKLLKDTLLEFTEGDTVQANYDGTNFFYGYIFSKKRDKNSLVDVTAYDQLRYLKNKDIYIFLNIKAGDAIKRIADDFQLQTGTIADTEYVIPKYRGSNDTLIDIIQNLLDMTTQNVGKIYVLYDNFGKLTLSDVEDLKVNLLLDNEAAEDYSYESSIDKDTYNRIKLYYDNKDEGKRDVWLSVDSANIKRWGVLQMTKSVNPKKAINFAEMADTLLKSHNRVKRTLSIQNAFGNLKIRAGSMFYINLDFGDVKLTKPIIVESVKHKFSNNLHLMDLTVRGDVITG
ncbi:XkdQ/YqbQ family protein [Pectinatus frisingensis]|uniref:XkdQ/YqbQ family protein n=2 Tax=Pectinatus frisingensis TaxID=865 RepID=UPI003D809FBF